MGIEAAHRNHIIHRDIKPQNIIISRDGKVKVTDFGIAKAATSNTITSNVMGSVHYTSPEQARGGYSDEKSDIYSLGVTLFEMLTGRVPFNGETTVAIAIKHIQEEMPSPREYVGEIPVSVEDIVMKCCQKSPDRRYQSMAELIADLKQALISPDEPFVIFTDPDMEAGTRMLSDDDMEEIKRNSSYQESREYQEYGTLRLRTDAEAEYEESAEDEEPEEEDEYDYDPRMERFTTALAVIAGVVICIIILILAVNIFKNMSTEDNDTQGPFITEEQEAGDQENETENENVNYVQMPDVVGLNEEDAGRRLAQLGLLADIVYENSDTIDEGVVIRVDTETGAEVPEGKTILLTVSSGTGGIKIPEFSGKTYAEANSQLLSLVSW
jgi:serine/threonine-protein kinase